MQTIPGQSNKKFISISRIPDWLVALMRHTPFRGRPKPEEAICLAFAAQMRSRVLYGAYKGIFFHVPNESKRTVIHGCNKRALGLIAGVSDYVLMWRDKDGTANNCFIEFKAGKNKQNDNQRFFADWCKQSRFTYVVCYSSDEALGVLENLGAFG